MGDLNGRDQNKHVSGNSQRMLDVLGGKTRKARLRRLEH